MVRCIQVRYMLQQFCLSVCLSVTLLQSESDSTDLRLVLLTELPLAIAKLCYKGLDSQEM